MENNPGRIEKIADETANYIELRVAEIKLSLVEHLAKIFSNATALILLTVMVSMAFVMFIAAMVVWISTLTGSLILALVIGGFLTIIVAIVLFFVVRSLVANRFIAGLSQMFFNPNATSDEKE